MNNKKHIFFLVTLLTQLAACSGHLQVNGEVLEIKSQISKLDTSTYAKSINVSSILTYGTLGPENRFRASLSGSSGNISDTVYVPGHGPFTGQWQANSSTYYISLYDLENDEELTIFGGHLGKIECLSFSPDGNLLASGGHDGAVFIWNVEAQNEQAVFSAPAPRNPKPFHIKRLEFFDLGKKIMAIRNKGDVIVIDAKTGTNIGHIVDYEGQKYNSLVGMAYNPSDNTYLVVGKKFISIRDPETGKQNRLLMHPDLDSVVDMEVDSVNNRLILTRRRNNDSTIMIWDMLSYKLIYAMTEKQRKISKTSLSPDGRILVSAGDDAVLNFWDLQKNKIVHAHRFNKEGKYSNFYVSRLNFSAGGDKIFYEIKRITGQ